MLDLLPTVLAASTVKSVGAVIAAIVTIGFIWYVVVNIRAGRAEVASEIELAPNRKPYYDDEGLEGPRLDGALRWAVMMLAVSAIGLPLYWLAEPSRQEGAIEQFDRTFVGRGARLFAPTEDGGYNCAGCHGPEGVGGAAPDFTLLDAEGEFDATMDWQAPALNTVLLRFSEDEVREVLVYGRPGTPMPAWGTEGGGPLTTQQIDELIAYLDSIQITSEDAKELAEKTLREELALAEDAEIDYADPAVGEAIFNLGLPSGTAGGAFSCARCHTKGASLVDGSQDPEFAELSEHRGFPDGSGAFGFSLRYPLIPRQFLSAEDLLEFLRKGSVENLLYGQRGVGSGRMPGFGDNPNTLEPVDDGMFTEEMLQAVAVYVANLHLDGQGDTAPAAGGTPAVPPAVTLSDVTTTTTTAAPTTAEES
ncbi:MAG: cytochrome c [Acidimicrobiales bacterium]|nr:cytochrome c [Acidimicrobiales bacterium]